ncbi:MAG: cytochrome c-type biogenesis protein CcmH [Proteobacteria bacterium]|nr:cytochrome c-type biogenesis protein CcmH [Pseudomonadota bacterium]
MIRLLAILTLFAFLPTDATAVDPDDLLADPKLEARARDVGRHLRCLVCQNQSIDDSDAQLARDLRVLVRERIVAGDSNQKVIDYVVSRYGDFVLLQPPFKAKTYVLWFGPAAFLVLGGLVAFMFYRRRGDGATQAAAPLTDAERRKLAEIMKSDDA